MGKRDMKDNPPQREGFFLWGHPLCCFAYSSIMSIFFCSLRFTPRNNRALRAKKNFGGEKIFFIYLLFFRLLFRLVAGFLLVSSLSLAWLGHRRFSPSLSSLHERTLFPRPVRHTRVMRCPFLHLSARPRKMSPRP